MSGWFPVPERNYVDPISRLIPYQHNQQTNNQAGDCMAAFSLPIDLRRSLHSAKPPWQPVSAHLSTTYRSDDLSNAIVPTCYISTSIL